jgi:hypothetical protein
MIAHQGGMKMIRKILLCTVLLIALVAIPTMATVAKGPKLPPEKTVTFAGDLVMDSQKMWVDSKGFNLTIAGYPDSLILSENFYPREGGYNDAALRIELTEKNDGKAEMIFNFSVGTFCGTEKPKYHFEGSGNYNYDNGIYTIYLSEADLYESVEINTGKRCKVENIHYLDVHPIVFTMEIGE